MLLRSLGPLTLLLTSACHGAVTSIEAAKVPAKTVASVTPTQPELKQCRDAPAPPSAPDPIVGKVAVWSRPLEARPGDLTFDVAGDLLVARVRGSKSESIALENGATCAVLAQPSLPGAELQPIDVYSARSTLLEGTLIGPSGLALGAVEARTGAVRWRQAVAGLDPRVDEYALRDDLELVAAHGLGLATFRVHRAETAGYRTDRWLLGLELRNGHERWQRVFEGADSVPAREPKATLVSDGESAMLLLQDRLVGIDATSGTDAWSARWEEAGAPSLFAGNGRALLAFPKGKLLFWEAASGKPAGALALSVETVTDALLGRDLTLLAVEDAVGTASVVALDREQRVLWKHDAVYSVSRLRLASDAQRVYVLEGNGRLLALDAATGAPRAALTVGEVTELAVSAGREGRTRVVVPIAGLSAFEFEPDEKPAPLPAFLRWQLFPETSTEGGFSDFCTPRAVEWVGPDERVIWRRELPAHLQRDSRESCRYYRRHPRQQTFNRTLETETALAIASPSGVLVLRRSDGAVLLDANVPNRAGFLFDNGDFYLENGPTCAGPAPSIFALCDEHLLFFNGTAAVWIDTRSWRVQARGNVGPLEHADQSGVHTEARVPLGKLNLVLRGTTYMH
jgi:hypothetical protein